MITFLRELFSEELVVKYNRVPFDRLSTKFTRQYYHSAKFFVHTTEVRRRNYFTNKIWDVGTIHLVQAFTVVDGEEYWGMAEEEGDLLYACNCATESLIKSIVGCQTSRQWAQLLRNAIEQ